MSSVGTRGSALAVGFAFPIIDGILVSLRFYARRQLNVDRGVDDWLCIPAWLCLTGCCASMLTGIYKGAFDDAPLSDPDQVAKREQTLAQVTAALVIFWMGANFLIKLIMLFFYRRIFKVTGKAFNICNWTLVGMSAVWFVYAVASWLFYCGTNFHSNFEGPWKGCAPWGFEIQMGVFAMDSFIDFCLLVMPIPFIWRIQLDWKKKLALVVVFVLGAFAFVAGLNNTIIQLVELTNPSLAHSGGAANFFQGSSLLFSNWPAIEIGVGLLASNLPPLSFRIARLLKDGLPRALRISINSIRHAAAAISLTSLHGSNRNNGARQSHEEGRERRPGSSQGLWPDQASTQSIAPSHTRSFEQNSAQRDKIYVSSEVKVERHGGDFV